MLGKKTQNRQVSRVQGRYSSPLQAHCPGVTSISRVGSPPADLSPYTYRKNCKVLGFLLVFFVFVTKVGLCFRRRVHPLWEHVLGPCCVSGGWLGCRLLHTLPCLPSCDPRRGSLGGKAPPAGTPRQQPHREVLVHEGVRGCPGFSHGAARRCLRWLAGVPWGQVAGHRATHTFPALAAQG